MELDQLDSDHRPQAEKFRKIVLKAQRRLGKDALSDASGSVQANETMQYAQATELETIPQAS